MIASYKLLYNFIRNIENSAPYFNDITQFENLEILTVSIFTEKNLITFIENLSNLKKLKNLSIVFKE